MGETNKYPVMSLVLNFNIDVSTNLVIAIYVQSLVSTLMSWVSKLTEQSKCAKLVTRTAKIREITRSYGFEARLRAIHETSPIPKE